MVKRDALREVSGLYVPPAWLDTQDFELPSHVMGDLVGPLGRAADVEECSFHFVEGAHLA